MLQPLQEQEKVCWQDINSLLSNDDELADKMLQAGRRFGDPN